MKNQTKKAYNELAEHYYKLRKKDTKVKFYKEMIETPTLLKVMGNVKNKKILDLGCGPGIHAKKLTKKGAKVTGIDNSEESIKLAKKESPNTKFFVGDIEKLPFKSNTFDIVLSAMVIGHIKNWNKMLKEVNRVLKKRGIFIFSIHNPFKEVLVKTKWKGKEFKLVKNYFNEKAIVGIWENSKKSFTIKHYHKTYGTIIKLLLKYKFELKDYEDCKPIKKAEEKFPNKYKTEINMPRFCVWKFKKK